MNRALIRDALPPELRLALVYAPARSRDALLAVLGLDQRLAHMVSGAREPILAQVRLAWWRERLADDAPAIAGEPLLELVRDAAIARAPLRALVDGWEGLVGEPCLEAVAQLADARAAALCRVPTGAANGQAGMASAREWALHDLSRMPGEWGALADSLADAEVWAARPLPRGLRPLAIMHALARRSRKRGSVAQGPGAIAVAVRVGLFGR